MANSLVSFILAIPLLNKSKNTVDKATKKEIAEKLREIAVEESKRKADIDSLVQNKELINGRLQSIGNKVSLVLEKTGSLGLPEDFIKKLEQIGKIEGKKIKLDFSEHDFPTTADGIYSLMEAFSKIRIDLHNSIESALHSFSELDKQSRGKFNELYQNTKSSGINKKRDFSLSMNARYGEINSTIEDSMGILKGLHLSYEHSKKFRHLQ